MTISPILLTIQDITNLLPHRFPMLLLDRFEITEPLQRGRGIKNVTINEWFFEGHFPTHPIMPGVLIVEALAQAAGVLVMHGLAQEKAAPSVETDKVYFMGLDEVRFRKPVTPGDQLILDVEKTQHRGNVWKFAGKAYVGEALVAHALFTAMISKG